MSKYIKLKDAIEYACKAHISGCVGDRIRAQLQSLPTIEVSEDAISRQGLINTLNARHIKYNAYVNEAILNAPSVVPSRPKGEWIEEMERHFLDSRIQTNVEMKEATGKGYHTYINQRCSICNKVTMADASIRYDFCPHCGADIRGGKE